MTSLGLSSIRLTYINRPVKFTVFKLEELDQLNKDLHGLNLIGSQLETDVEDYVSELKWVRRIHRSFYTEPIKLRGEYSHYEHDFHGGKAEFEIFFGVSDVSEESIKSFFCFDPYVKSFFSQF